MTFHQRVEEAQAFAEKMPATAAELYTAEASAGALAHAEELPASSIDAELYELEDGRHVPPDRVWADWLCGDHPIAHRRKVIHQFANGINASNRRVHRAFLASVRALGVGVDITGLRGVEAVCIVGSRSSQVDVVQNIGRALRPNPDGTVKTARLIIPIFLAPGEDPKDGMLASLTRVNDVRAVNTLLPALLPVLVPLHLLRRLPQLLPQPVVLVSGWTCPPSHPSPWTPTSGCKPSACAWGWPRATCEVGTGPPARSFCQKRALQ